MNTLPLLKFDLIRRMNLNIHLFYKIYDKKFKILVKISPKFSYEIFLSQRLWTWSVMLII